MRFLIITCILTAALHAAEGGSEIGVIDYAVLFTTVNYHTEATDQIDARRLEIEEFLTGLEEQMAERERQLEGLSRSNENYLRLQVELEQIRATYETQKDYHVRAHNRRVSAAYENSYAKTVAYLPDFCRQHGIRMVFRAPAPEIHAADFQSAITLLNQLDLIYYDESLDITEDFIVYANHRYAQEQQDGQQGDPSSDGTDEDPDESDTPIGTVETPGAIIIEGGD